MHHHTPHVPSASHIRASLAIHAMAFCLINVLLVLINVSTGGDLWFQWPLLGWGAGLAYHAWAVSRRVGLYPERRGQRPSEAGRGRPDSSDVHAEHTV